MTYPNGGGRKRPPKEDKPMNMKTKVKWFKITKSMYTSDLGSVQHVDADKKPSHWEAFDNKGRCLGLRPTPQEAQAFLEAFAIRFGHDEDGEPVSRSPNQNRAAFEGRSFHGTTSNGV